MDERFAEILRKANIPIVLAANKCEGKAGLSGLYDAFKLGFGEPVALSAEHGEGFGDLFEAFREALGEDGLQAAFTMDKEEEDIQRGEDVLSKLEGINVDDPNLTDEDLQTALQEAGILDEEEQTPQAETEARPIKWQLSGGQMQVSRHSSIHS